MSRWWTSDLHLGHARICELAQRPFASVDEMNEALIDRWNSVVAPGDTVFILGDLVMGRFAETIQLVPRLNGNKMLIPGNHDRIHPVYQDTRPHKVAEWRRMYRDAGVLDIGRVKLVWLADRFVAMCHFPYDADDLGRSDYDAFRPEPNIMSGDWLLHGHTHGRGLPPDQRNPLKGHQIDVGVDLWDYTPVAEEQLIDLVRSTP